MILRRQREPLALENVPVPDPKQGELLIRIEACAVCRTDLHVVDAELPNPNLPLIIGHQIAGVVERAAGDFREGDRAGVPWLGLTDGVCHFCMTGRENLCDRARVTGYTHSGGHVAYCGDDARYCIAL